MGTRPTAGGNARQVGWFCGRIKPFRPAAAQNGVSHVKAIPPSLLQRAVQGHNLQPGTLAEQMGDKPTLLVFLRHFG